MTHVVVVAVVTVGVCDQETELILFYFVLTTSQNLIMSKALTLSRVVVVVFVVLSLILVGYKFFLGDVGRGKRDHS